MGLAAAAAAVCGYRLFFPETKPVKDAAKAKAAALKPPVPDVEPTPEPEAVEEEDVAPPVPPRPSRGDSQIEDVSLAHEAPKDAPEVPAEAPIAAAPVSEKDGEEATEFVVAFDFDKCLMQNHWWGTYRMSPIEDVNPGPSDFAHSDIASLFKRVLSVPGVKLAVASFGRNDVIRKAIVSAIPDQADQVFITTPGDFEGYQDGWSMGANFKNLELNRIAQRFGGLALDKIAFFDDDKNNIRAACELGVNAHTTAPFTDEHEALVFAHIGRPDLANTKG